ncbi:MAG: tetratricopeptide repeat protein, partial [Anaerolineae bacterium]|nr:tetratricopeptide repeat protein [Anaerolineae bacterium]
MCIRDRLTNDEEQTASQGVHDNAAENKPLTELTNPFSEGDGDDDPIGEAEVQIDIESELEDDREAWLNDLISTSTPHPPPPSNDTSLYELEDAPVEIAEPLEWSVVYNDVAEVPETDSHLNRKPNVTEAEPEWLSDLRAQSGSVWVPANDNAPPNAKPTGSALVAPPEINLSLPDLPPPVEWMAELSSGTPAINPAAKPAGIIAAAEAEAAAAKRPKRPSKKDLAALEQIAVARQTLNEGRLDASTELYTNIIKNGRKLDEVVQDLSNVAKTSQHSARLYRLLGDAYTKQGNLNAALAAYQQGLRKRVKG